MVNYSNPAYGLEAETNHHFLPSACQNNENNRIEDKPEKLSKNICLDGWLGKTLQKSLILKVRNMKNRGLSTFDLSIICPQLDFREYNFFI